MDMQKCRLELLIRTLGAAYNPTKILKTEKLIIEEASNIKQNHVIFRGYPNERKMPLVLNKVYQISKHFSSEIYQSNYDFSS